MGFLHDVTHNFFAMLSAVIGIAIIVIGIPISCFASIVSGEGGWIFLIPLVIGLGFLAITRALAKRA